MNTSHISANKDKVTEKVFPGYKPVPVLHIIKSLGRGGAETLLPETLSKHDKTKFIFHYIYFLPWKNQVVDEIEKQGGKVTCLSAGNNIQIILKIRSIAAYIKLHKIQLIHCHLPWAGIVGRLAGIITKVPVVYTEHNIWEHYHKMTYYFNKLSFSSQKQVIAVSNNVASSIKANYRRSQPPVRVIANGINTEKYSPSSFTSRNIREELNIDSTTIVVGIVSVFRAQKRLDIWLEIAAELKKKVSNIFFIVVGDGVLKEEIHQKARKLQMEEYIHFAGMQSETRPYLSAMDIFMMSSEFEGMPIALLEGMSMGCMPACTDAGGIPELIQDGMNGILVPANQPMQLASRLPFYLNDLKAVKALGKAARENVINRFGMQKMVNELESVYGDTIK